MQQLNNTNNLVHMLSFDQYGRYRMIQEALDAARTILTPHGHLRVLDVGGFVRAANGTALLPLREFLPHDDITVIDQHAETMPGYMQGDGRTLPCDAALFDVVVSCDTLEHIPAPDRAHFWSELLRVARHGVLLAAPFASPEVERAEALLFDFIQVELGIEQPQLKEHRDYGLPLLATTQHLLDERNLAYMVYPSGYVHAWLVMMFVRHYLSARQSDLPLLQALDGYYTRFLAHAERREPAYRHLIVTSSTSVPHKHQPQWLAAVDAALTPTLANAHGTSDAAMPAWNELVSWMFQLVNLRLGEHRMRLLIEMITQQTTMIDDMQRTLSARDAELHELRAKVAWLDGESRNARNALQAVERGRVLRLLRWVQQRLHR